MKYEVSISASAKRSVYRDAGKKSRQGCALLRGVAAMLERIIALVENTLQKLIYPFTVMYQGIHPRFERVRELISGELKACIKHAGMHESD